MVFGWQDKQCMDMKHLFDAEPAPFKDPTKFMSDPASVTPVMKGQVSSGMRDEDMQALVRYYITHNAIVRGLWMAAIEHFRRTHTVTEFNAAGIKQPERGGALGGFEFKTQGQMYSFYKNHFRSEYFTLTRGS